MSRKCTPSSRCARWRAYEGLTESLLPRRPLKACSARCKSRPSPRTQRGPVYRSTVAMISGPAPSSRRWCLPPAPGRSGSLAKALCSRRALSNSVSAAAAACAGMRSCPVRVAAAAPPRPSLPAQRHSLLTHSWEGKSWLLLTLRRPALASLGECGQPWMALT